jgi:hypothetical protein
MSGVVAGYSWWLLRKSQRKQKLSIHHQEQMDNMRLQLHISGATASHDQKLVLQFVAYLEKFTTKQQSYSRESLLLAQ